MRGGRSLNNCPELVVQLSGPATPPLTLITFKALPESVGLVPGDMLLLAPCRRPLYQVRLHKYLLIIAIAAGALIPVAVLRK